MDMRFRNKFLIIGGLLTIVLWVITDPNLGLIENIPFGASTIILLAQLLKAIWYVGFLHASRRALLDYVDLQSIIRTASQTPEGAGRVAMAIGLIYIAVAIAMFAAVMSN